MRTKADRVRRNAPLRVLDNPVVTADWPDGVRESLFLRKLSRDNWPGYAFDGHCQLTRINNNGATRNRVGQCNLAESRSGLSSVLVLPAG